MPTAVALVAMIEAPDWKAAADAAAARRAELGITQEDVIERMGETGINIEAYRRFERNEQGSYRRTTLAAISVALGWPADTLYAIAQRRPTPATPSELSEIRQQIAAQEQTINQIAETVQRLQEAVAQLAAPSRAAKRPGR